MDRRRAPAPRMAARWPTMLGCLRAARAGPWLAGWPVRPGPWTGRVPGKKRARPPSRTAGGGQRGSSFAHDEVGDDLHPRVERRRPSQVLSVDEHAGGIRILGHEKVAVLGLV